MSRIEQRPRRIVCERPADLALRRCHVLHVGPGSGPSVSQDICDLGVFEIDCVLNAYFPPASPAAAGVADAARSKGVAKK